MYSSRLVLHSSLFIWLARIQNSNCNLSDRVRMSQDFSMFSALYDEISIVIAISLLPYCGVIILACSRPISMFCIITVYFLTLAILLAEANLCKTYPGLGK